MYYLFGKVNVQLQKTPVNFFVSYGALAGLFFFILIVAQGFNRILLGGFVSMKDDNKQSKYSNNQTADGICRSINRNMIGKIF